MSSARKGPTDHDELLAVPLEQPPPAEHRGALAHQGAERTGMPGEHLRAQAGPSQPAEGLRGPAHGGVDQEQDAAGEEVRGRRRDDRIEERPPVTAGVDGPAGPAAGEVLAGGGDVRRVGDHGVEAPPRDGAEEAPADGLDADARPQSVHAAGGDRPAGDVDRRHAGAEIARGTDRDGAGARAELEDPRATGEGLVGEGVGEQPGVGAGTEHPRKAQRLHGSAGSPPAPPANSALDPDALQEAFTRHRAYTVGIEEELMVLHPRTLDLHPVAGEIVDALGGEGVAREMPAAQLELMTPPARTVGEACAALAAGRRRAARAAEGTAVLAGAGTHPFAREEGVVTPAPRYRDTEAEYGALARRQMVFGLHVHVALPDAAAVIPVHDALRAYLPLIGAVAANAPFHGGQDTGLASVRPVLAGLLTRQGIPPPLRSWEGLAEALRWGAASGAVADPGRWWWDLRLNVRTGTVEVRVADAQATIADVAVVAALVHALVAWLGVRHAAGEVLRASDTWRIAENRWWACRDGAEARLAHLGTGERRPVADLVAALLARIGPVAQAVGCAGELAGLPALVASGGAARQRALAEKGLDGVARGLAAGFLDGVPG